MTQLKRVLDEAAHLAPEEKRKVIRELSSQLDVHIADEAISHPGISGQVEGYWFRSETEVPASKPAYDPTRAVRPAGRLEDNVDCLDLVDIDGVRHPLSESGVHTYAHSGSLVYGQPYFFAPASRWGTLYKASLGSMEEPERIGTRFPPEASQRARPDRKVVVLHLSRVR